MINNKTVEEKKQNPTDATVPGSIIIAPRIESMDVTIVMGDQKSSYMNFNGGEAYMVDPHDDGFGDDEFVELDEDDESEEDLPDEDDAAEVMDEIDRSACPECEYTDCVEHPTSQKEQMRVKDSAGKPGDAQKPEDTQQGTKHTSKFMVTEGDAALEGLPGHFKSFIKLLQAAGLGVEIKKYEQKEAQSGE